MLNTFWTGLWIWDTDFAGMSPQFLEDASIFNHWALTIGRLKEMDFTSQGIVSNQFLSFFLLLIVDWTGFSNPIVTEKYLKDIHMLFTLGCSLNVFWVVIPLMGILCPALGTALEKRSGVFWGYSYEKLKRKNCNQNAQLRGKCTIKPVKILYRFTREEIKSPSVFVFFQGIHSI